MKCMNIQYSKAHRTNCTNSVDLMCTELVEAFWGSLLVRQSRQRCTTVVNGLLGIWAQCVSRKAGHTWEDREVWNS